MENYKKKSWFGRNWLWVLPVGGCLTLIVLIVLGAGTLFFGVSKMFTSSEPYKYAMEQVSNNEEVISILGEPIEKDGMLNGNINLSGGDGEADFRIPISGPNGTGRIVVKATKSYGKWTYEKLYTQFQGEQNDINLLDKSLEGN
ncbi:cytochrome c oxidase assembly factor Coa1 family protein [Winogradskyella ouciana]|uniref:cytochrome c oxidase assembly factor Coa1 family protein n=1 Tax=Winogradskyella ouciana TaxID=2608631 RepID=UPI003D2E0147